MMAENKTSSWQKSSAKHVKGTCRQVGVNVWVNDSEMFLSRVYLCKRAISTTFFFRGTSVITRRSVPGNVCEPDSKLYCGYVIILLLLLLLRYLSEMKGSRYMPYLCFWCRRLLKCWVTVTDVNLSDVLVTNETVNFQLHTEHELFAELEQFYQHTHHPVSVFVQYQGWDPFYLHFHCNKEKLLRELIMCEYFGVTVWVVTLHLGRSFFM